MYTAETWLWKTVCFTSYNDLKSNPYTDPYNVSESQENLTPSGSADNTMTAVESNKAAIIRITVSLSFTRSDNHLIKLFRKNRKTQSAEMIQSRLLNMAV